MSISTEAMVLNLQIGSWAGYKLDKEQSKEVTEGAGADGDAARVNKHLISKDTLKPINVAADAVRRHFYTKTLPWKDNGDRLLPRAAFEKFIERHEELAHEFTVATSKFIETNYAAARERAQFRMGSMFRAEDYPEPEALRPRFYVRLEIDPVTEAGDFRVAMDQTALDSLIRASEAQLKERLARASGDVWRRLADTLGHFADRMQGDERFREATLTNLVELAETLPALNFTGDADISGICAEIAQRFGALDAKTLRTKPLIRQVVSSEAQEIMDRVSGLMAAMGGNQ